MIGRTAGIAAGAFANALLLPDAALAHRLSARSDLPIPDWLFGWAAAVVLAVSFFAFAVLWQSPRLETAEPRLRMRMPQPIGVLCGAIGVAITGLLIWAGMVGSQSETANVVPTFVYVFAWVLLPVLSAVFGDVFRAFNPWLAVGRLVRFVLTRLRSGPPSALLDYPERFGRWPAVALLFGFGYLELISPSGRDPSTLAWLILAYGAIQLAGMTAFGIERWAERGDALGLYLNLFSRLAPLAVQSGRLVTRLPLSGLTDMTWLPASVFFLCTAIGITAFDGASEGSLWQSLSGELGDAFGVRLAATIGLVGTILLIAGFFRLGVEGMVSSAIDKPPSDLARIFAPSLVPILLAYVLAHYFSFVVFQGQALWAQISDPLGEGADWFGTASAGIDYSLLSSSAIWYFQTAFLVAGHVAGLAVAHDKALAVWGKARAAVRSQLWMLVVMVGFTNLGLWLLSQANQ